MCGVRRALTVPQVIEARGLGKRYGDTVAVDRLTFTVRPGIVHGLLGPNSAGKSRPCGSSSGWTARRREP
jgi:ABC-2 type transport system ATP-binding protein